MKSKTAPKNNDIPSSVIGIRKISLSLQHKHYEQKPQNLKTMTKRILSLILACVLCLTGGLAQKQEGKILPKVLINGHYFESMPTLPEEVLSGVADTVLVLTDKNGNEVKSYRFASKLPDSVVKLAIPKKQVQNARYFSNQDETQRRTIEQNRKMAEGFGNRDILPKVGKTFPLFQEKDISGRFWSFDDIFGRVTVFYLWHSGCVQCLSEMNELSMWKQMNPDVLFLSVTWNDPGTVKRIVQQYHFTWTHLCNVHEMITWVSQGAAGKASIRNYPLTIVVDRQGIVRRVVSGTDAQTRQETLQCIQQYK